MIFYSLLHLRPETTFYIYYSAMSCGDLFWGEPTPIAEEAAVDNLLLLFSALP